MPSTLTTTLLLVAAGSKLALGSANVQVTNINGNNNQVSNSATASTKLKPKRDLSSLFRRDPEFEEHMQMVAREATNAQNVKQMAADIRKGTSSQQVVEVAHKAGLIKNVDGMTGKNAVLPNPRPNLSRQGNKGKQHGKRSPLPTTKPKKPYTGKRGPITAPKGTPYTPARLDEHYKHSTYTPQDIKDAIQSSPHYLNSQQFSSNPTAAPLAKRDLDGNVLHVRADGALSIDEFAVLIRSMERDPEAKKGVMAALKSDSTVENMTGDLIKKYTKTNGKVNFKNMRTLVAEMQSDPKAERAVLDAFNKNEQIAKVTQGLFDMYSSPADLQSRDADDLAGLLTERGINGLYENFATRDVDNLLIELDVRHAEAEAADIEELEFLAARDPELEFEAEYLYEY